MTTKTWTTGLSHASDDDFRAWGGELSAKLSEVGLVQTADTGQINWSTVTRPSVSAAAGYEIWRFNDTLQATAPILIKVEYGTAGSAVYPQMWATVGTSSNGSGTLTGTLSGRNLICHQGGVFSGNTPSYLCSVPGHFGLAWKIGALAGVGTALFVVARTHDASGAPTATGAIVYFGVTNMVTNRIITQSLRFAATASAYAYSDVYSIVPGQVSSSVVGSNPQVFAHFGISPEVWTVPTMATVLLSEVPQFSSFPVAMVGSTQRTLLSLGASMKPVVTSVGPGSATTYGFAMLYE